MTQWLSQLKQRFAATDRFRIVEDLRIGVLVGTAVTIALLGLRSQGALQPLELSIFDQMTRLRPPRTPDDRILVVEVTQADRDNLPDQALTDAVLAELLTELQRHQPVAIGIDVLIEPPYPPGTEALHAAVQASNAIAVMSVGNGPDELKLPPSVVPPDQIGFSDFPIDPDGKIRRSTLTPFDPQLDYPSLSLRLVQAYLAANCPGYTPRSEGAPCRERQWVMQPDGTVQFGTIPFPRLDRQAGAYHQLDNRGYQFLLNYRAADNATHQVTLTQVLQGDVDPMLIRDKIVLIGFSAPTLKDLFFTPYSSVALGHRQMPGVVLHAQMTSQLLSVVLDGDRLFWFWPEWAEIAWMMLWSGLGVGVAWLTRRPLRLIVGLGGLLLILLGGSFILFLSQGWIPVAAPAIAFAASSVVMIVYRQYQAQQQHQTVMRLLGQQTSPEIASALWEGRHHLIESGRLPWQRLTATLLFCDIKGFSTVAEQQPPELVMGWLNEYLTEMTDAIQRHQGVVNKFMGDGVMAVFGVPIARTDPADIAADAQHAVYCALAMRQQLNVLNQTWRQQGLKTMQMRIGIFTGSVMVGSLGGRNRLEYGVIGDSVNTASRLESCEKERQVDDCRILIAQETLNYLGDRLEVESWGPLMLKGKHQSVAVYRVIGLANPVVEPVYPDWPLALPRPLPSASFGAESDAV